MPSFKPTAPWHAAPHTLAKIEIIQKYLYRWFSILGKSKRPGTRLVYIDGFAGPGEYSNSSESSPMAALTAARDALAAIGTGLSEKECCFLFVEKNKDLAEHLRSVVEKVELPPQIKWQIEEGTFEEKVGGILGKIKSEGQQLAPTFAFIDPFGVTGIPFSVVAEILSHPSCEVLVNLDSDGIGRLIHARSFEENRAHLDKLFGDNSWASELNPALPMQQLARQVLALYKRRLRTLSKVKYVYAFAMNTRKGQINYHLVFASQHPLGLEKMKEAMKAVDKSGSFSFSDDSDEQQMLLFDFNRPDDWALRMAASLAGPWRTFADFRDYALSETPFGNPKAMLRHLSLAERVEVEWHGLPPRRNTFPEEKIRRIRVKE